jgi:glycosylphosphatidylinositol phospholipase D
MEIKGTIGGAGVSYAVAGIGDVNGDGLADVGVGAPWPSCCGVGDAYVVFGKPGTDPIELLEPRGAAIRIRGETVRDDLGYSFAALGDVDSDGLDDFVVGARGAAHNGRSGSGSVYVIRGRSTWRSLRLARGGWHLRVDGAKTGHGAAHALAAGDFSGDGRLFPF